MFGSDPSRVSVGRTVFVEPLVLGVVLNGPPLFWDFGGVKLFSPVEFVGLFLSCILVILPLSTLVDSVVSLMDLSLSATIGLYVDSKSASNLAFSSLIV